MSLLMKNVGAVAIVDLFLVAAVTGVSVAGINGPL
jgi:hypothetical protein